MRRADTSLRTLLISGIAFALTAASCGATTTVEQTSTYGVVADPPLPTSVPIVPLSAPGALANHDGSVIVSLEHSSQGDDGPVDQATLLFQTGTVATTSAIAVEVGDDAELRAVSADGTRAALFERLPDEAGADAARVTSRITVVDRSSGAPERWVYELTGLVEPEAFSTDGGELFVIDHTVGSEGYRVRPFDLATGRLKDILGPTKVPFDDVMNGVGRRQVWSPQADRLYTLYIRQTHHHHQPDEAGADAAEHGHPEPGTDGFVHVLDLAEEWAFCLDLPPSFGGGDLATTALAVSPDGETVAVADLDAQAVAFASTSELEVTGTRPLSSFAADGELQLGLSGPSNATGTDGAALFLASGNTGQWYNAETLAKLTDEPTEFSVPIRGLTSMPGGVLVWTTDLERAPTQLARPITPAG